MRCLITTNAISGRVFSPKDKEALKGDSNGGYHYFGSAKILTQMGNAFAEALLPFQK